MGPYRLDLHILMLHIINNLCMVSLAICRMFGSDSNLLQAQWCFKTVNIRQGECFDNPHGKKIMDYVISSTDSHYKVSRKLSVER